MMAVQLWWPPLPEAALAVVGIADTAARDLLTNHADKAHQKALQMMAVTVHLCPKQQDMSVDCMEENSAVTLLPGAW